MIGAAHPAGGARFGRTPAFAPNAAEVERARAVLAATDESGVARTPDGTMVDPAMRAAAQRVVDLAER